jgi:hypothetical protein
MAKAYAKEQCRSYGWSEDDYNSLVQLWEKESGWNVAAGDPNKAYGIPQACPGNKMASCGADWKTNYETQINWGLSYIKDRYGNPSNAWNHFLKKNWY